MLKIMISALVLLFVIIGPLCLVYYRVKTGRRSKRPLITQLIMFFGFVAAGSIFMLTQSAFAAEASEAAGNLIQTDGFAKGMGYLSAALAVGMSGIGGGIAVSASATAALGAISENEGTFGKALIFVGMAEGVALYGLLIAFMIISGL